MHIHFVCSGNVFRSRLAEAYCRSKAQNSKITVSSSGINAVINQLKNGPICWYAMKLLKRHNIIPFMSWHQQQSTTESIKNVDLLICMRKEHLDYCQKDLGYKGESEMWDIPDLDEMTEFAFSIKPDIDVDINHIKLSEQIFETIIQKVDDLIARLSEK